MIIRQSIFAAFAALMLASTPAGAQTSGANEACKARCEQRACQATRVSKGECALQCARRCKEAGRKKR
jgi:hypothetical protein